MIRFNARLLWRTAAIVLALGFIAFVATLAFSSGGGSGSAEEAVKPPVPNAPPKTPPPASPTADPLSVKPPTLSPADVARAAALPTATEAPARVENGVTVLEHTTNTLDGGQTYRIGGLQFTVPKGLTLNTKASTAGFIFEDAVTGSVLRIDNKTSKEVYRRVVDGPAGVAVSASFDELVASFVTVEATP